MGIFSELIADISSLLTRYGGAYLNGIRNTLVLALAATAIGCVIGFVCGVLNTIPHRTTDNALKRAVLAAVRVVIRVYVEVFRGTPMVLQAVFIYYGMPYVTGGQVKFTNVWVAALLVVSINTGAYMAESVRGGIISVDPGQTEGAKAIGMTHVQTMMNVIIPQALRNIMPQVGNNFIINIKDTSVMFIISFTEFFAAHRGAVGATYKYFPSATIEMVGYLCMTLAASFILRAVERRMDGSDNYELVSEDQLVMTAGTYNYPDRGTPFDERSREYDKRQREARRAQARNSSTRGDR